MTLKRTQVVMLPTEKATRCIAIQYFKDGTSSMDFWETEVLREHPYEGFTEHTANCIVPQHLYFVSDEKPKSDEWFISHDEVFQVSRVTGVIIDTDGMWHESENCKKIIATTDPSLKIVIPRHNDFDSEFNLPKPSEDFLKVFCEQYNKGNQIKEVDVEYEKTFKRWSGDMGGNIAIYNDPTIKTNSKNEISIKKVKDTYTREEVKSILLKLMRGKIKFPSYNSDEMEQWYNQWIEENL